MFWAILGAVLGGASVAAQAAAASRQRREMERALEQQRAERARQLLEEKKATEAKNRESTAQMEKNLARRGNRYLFSPSGGLGLGEDDGELSLPTLGISSIRKRV